MFYEFQTPTMPIRYQAAYLTSPILLEPTQVTTTTNLTATPVFNIPQTHITQVSLTTGSFNYKTMGLFKGNIIHDSHPLKTVFLVENLFRKLLYPIYACIAFNILSIDSFGHIHVHTGSIGTGLFQ